MRRFTLVGQYLFVKNSSLGLALADLFGLTDATSNDGFCAGGVCDATGITAVAMMATTNTILPILFDSAVRKAATMLELSPNRWSVKR